jgi:hypothetical protein
MADQTVTSAPVEFNGVRIEMEERAHDGTFTLIPNRPAAGLKLDANSTLALHFKMPVADTTAQPTAEWRALDRALSELKQLTDEFERLSRQASNLDTVDIAEWQRQNTAFGKSLERFLDLLKGPELQRIISKEEVDRAPRQARLRGKPMYGLLAEMLESKRRDLIKKADKLGADLSADKVSVVAYVTPRSGPAQQIHVPGYDDIEAKPIQAISRTSPIPSAAEAMRLREEYEGAKIVSKSIGELMDKRNQIDDQIEMLGKKLADRAKQFVQAVRETADAFDEAHVAELLQALADAKTDDAKQFRDAVAAIKADVDMVQGIGEELESLVKDLRSADALELVLAMQRASALSASIKTQLDKVPGLIKKWPQHLETIAKTAGRVAAEPALQGKANLLTSINTISTEVTGDLRASGKALTDLLPELNNAITYIADQQFARHGADAISAAGAFDPAVQVITVNLDQAKDTEIDLRRSGIALGDGIEVKVSLLAGRNSTARDTTLTYAGEAVLTGWHRRYSGDVIFARAISGPGSDSYKPNAAVSLEWHYFDRQNQGGFWNWLDPGFGFHAANLDQDPDQTVELGAGVNVSVWNGLIRLAYGYNLSVQQDRPYFWIGFGLFGMLNRLNELPSSKP